jgi:hypothetical protein
LAAVRARLIASLSLALSRVYTLATIMADVRGDDDEGMM